MSETLGGTMANYGFTTQSGGNNGYDAEDRFMRFIRTGVSEDVTLTRSHIGNISNVNRNGTNTARAYNNAHGLTTVTGGVTQTYDLDGNTTKLNTNVTASWDDAGRTMNTNTPTGATAGVVGFNEYGYVGGTRVWKKITRGGSTFEHRVYIHAGPNLIAEYNAGAPANSPAQEYVYADQIDSLVMIHRSNNQKLGVTRNRQWSVVGLHDLANGNVVERYAYDMTGKRTIYAANGTTVRTTSSYGNNFGYTNRWHDEESGLMYFRARYYNPLTGEFLRRDPLEGWFDIEDDCHGLIENCCKKACEREGDVRYPAHGAFYSGRHTPVPWLKPEPKFPIDILLEEHFSNRALRIPHSKYKPTYSDYLFAWDSPHPHDPVDLLFTRGKIGRGVVGAVAGASAVGISVGPSVFYGGVLANSNKIPIATSVTGSLMYGAAGVIDPFPDATDIGMAAKPIKEAVENANKLFVRLYHGIGPKELDDVLREGHYVFNPSGSGKYFFYTECDLRRFAAADDNRFMRALTGVEIPSSVVREGAPVQSFGEGRAVFFIDEQLLEMYDGMPLPKILDSNCIPILGQGK